MIQSHVKQPLVGVKEHRPLYPLFMVDTEKLGSMTRRNPYKSGNQEIIVNSLLNRFSANAMIFSKQMLRTC